MNSISLYIARLRTNDFLRQNIVFFAGSLVVSVLNYLYYPVVGRLLPTAQFGEVQALVSLFLQATIFLGVVANVAVNVVANDQDNASSSRIVVELERFATLVVAAGLLVGLIFLPQIQHFLRFEHPLPFIVLGLSLLAGVTLTLRQAFLRGRNAFTQLSIVGSIAAGAKLVASAALVLLGLGTLGAVGGLVIAQLVTLIFVQRYARRAGFTAPHERWLRWPDLTLLKPQLPYAVLVLIVSLVSTLQFSFDILVVKHYFSAEVAGAYAGIATIARIIYFLTGSVAGVLLSTVKLDAPASAARGLLLRSMVLQIVLGGSALLAFALRPELFVRILIGPRYLSLASLLPELSLALFVIALINLILIYDMALRRNSAAIVAVLGAGVTAVLIVSNHATPAAVVRSLLIGSVIMLAIRGLDSIWRYLRTVVREPVRL